MDLTAVLENAQNPNPAIRNAAEAQLNEAVDKQYGPFVVALSAELATEGKPEGIRQLAGLYLKNLITAQDLVLQERKKEKWMTCDPNIKNQIRAAFLHAMLSPVPVVCHTAAQVAAAFGAIDIPEGQWPGLLSTLLHNVSSAEVGLPSKVGSLEALGYMCDGMSPDQVEKSVVDQILNTIVDGMRVDRPNEMKLAAITAMCNSLDFTETNFEIQVERDHIMTAICSATQCEDVRVRVKAFECLATVASFYYSKLPAYIDSLFQLTMKAIKTDVQAVGQQAIEFWSTICDTESQFVADIRAGEPLEDGVEYYKIIEQAAGGLVPELLETLTKQDDSDNDDSWNIAMAGAACLDVVAQTIEDRIVELILPFVTSNINSSLWRQKEAAIMAFGSILDGPSEEKLAPIVMGALPHLIGCVRDPHPMVRDTSAWTIGRICENHIQAITADVVAPMVTALTIALDDSESKVAAQACYAFYNMAGACDDSEAASNVLSNFLQPVLHKLLAVTNREDWDSDNLRTSAYEAINMLVTKSAEDMRPVIILLLAEALNRLEATWTTHSDPHEKMNLQSQLCSLIGTCVQRLPEDQLKSAISDRIMTLVLQVFQTKGAVAHEDAFMTIGYLAGKMGGEFSRYAKYLMPAVLAGLKNVEEHSVVTVAGGVVGDLCRAMGKGVLEYCDEIMRCLLELLQSQTVNREVKPHVISLFADIAMAVEGDFERYASIVLMMLQQAGQVNVTSDDDDLIEYVNTLREAILEAYTGIVQGLKSANKQEMMAPYLEATIEFIHRSTADETRTTGVLKAAVGLIGDLGDSFGPRMLPVFSQPFVIQLMQTAVSDEDCKDVGLWAQKIVITIRKKGPA